MANKQELYGTLVPVGHERDYYTIEAAARYLRVSIGTIKKKIEAGAIRPQERTLIYVCLDDFGSGPLESLDPALRYRHVFTIPDCAEIFDLDVKEVWESIQSGSVQVRFVRGMLIHVDDLDAILLFKETKQNIREIPHAQFSEIIRCADSAAKLITGHAEGR